MLRLVHQRLLPSTKLLFQCPRLQSTVPEASSDVPQIKTEAGNHMEHFDFFGVSKLFTVKNLFDNRMHLGHTVRSLTPQMTPFVFGTR